MGRATDIGFVAGVILVVVVFALFFVLNATVTKTTGTVEGDVSSVQVLRVGGRQFVSIAIDLLNNAGRSLNVTEISVIVLYGSSSSRAVTPVTDCVTVAPPPPVTLRPGERREVRVTVPTDDVPELSIIVIATLADGAGGKTVLSIPVDIRSPVPLPPPPWRR